MHIFHCWHEVRGSEKLVKIETRCQEDNTKIVKYTERCCICGKEREVVSKKRYSIVQWCELERKSRGEN